jgi:hypothetical protein
MYESKEIENFCSRTDRKLRFAQVHLNELKVNGINNGDDFERAHQESFVYHLLGAKEAFLIELNAYYRTELKGENISMGNLKNALEKKGMQSNELVELYKLENEEDSWLFHAKAIRDYSTHISDVPRRFHLGGENHQRVFLSNPKTGQIIERHLIDEFSDWINKMTELIERLRSTAVSGNKGTPPLLSIDKIG